MRGHDRSRNGSGVKTDLRLDSSTFTSNISSRIYHTTQIPQASLPTDQSTQIFLHVPGGCPQDTGYHL